MPKVSKLSGKRTVTGQNPGELYTKKHRRGNSIVSRVIKKIEREDEK